MKKLLDQLVKQKINKSVLLKIKSNLDDDQLKTLVLLATSYSYVSSFILSGLTKQRTKIKKSTQSKINQFPGGISGKPLQKLSDQTIKKVYRWTEGQYPTIGLGGVFNAADAYCKICLGASLIEIELA